MLPQPLKITFIALSALAAAAPAPAPTRLAERGPLNLLADPYAPVQTSCPSIPLVRPATSLNSDEASYVSSRKPNADEALAAWLQKQGNFSTSSLPALGFTSSGGGLRALLETAGVVQAFDNRDSNLSTSGVYQALTYEAGLSGGAWFLSSLAGNNWPTVSYLKENLWEDAFQNTALLPANLLSLSGLTEYGLIADELVDKQAAGYDVTIVDPYGRLLSYQLLEGASGGVSTRLSSLTSFSNFTNHNVPYPIITATGIDDAYSGQCYPDTTSTIYEFHPYEYGSWDSGISAFAQTAYMGTNLTAGSPTIANNCTVHYDNLGYVLGTSSDVFNGLCEVITPSNETTNDLQGLSNVLEGLVNYAHDPLFQDLFAIYPNPFYQYEGSTRVQSASHLAMADGGEGGQNNPIWPLIQAERSVDVLIVNDNSADTSDNFPNGTEIQQTYINAQNAGLTKMPYIPDVSTFVSEGLNKRATFFGCNQTGTTFIVYLPNVAYSYDSGQATAKVEYTKAETDGMIANGVQIATQNGTAGWPFCLACAVKNGDASSLPAGCDACFDEYCYYK
ncbi:hypothetical protein LTR36_001756 [Oleoguttula mirabilis]|uniref:Lysophospholipase n=1 Tax=Oleoguttula mirabilis TaxID=1507867 RepID=A0AAV9JME7_9PEZI|nr:hypothetical protein LTR36_001756 [Oleoguttula mirabilis]